MAVLRGLNLSRNLGDVDDKAAALINLGLSAGDIQLIYKLTDASGEDLAVSVDDIHTLANLKVDQKKDFFSIKESSDDVGREIQNISDIAVPLQHNMRINNQIKTNSLKYNYLNLTAANAAAADAIKKADVSTSRVSSWSELSTGNISYSGELKVIGDKITLLGTGKLSTSTAPIPRTFRAESPTHRVTIKINGANKKLVMMKGIPLIFEGYFKKAVLNGRGVGTDDRFRAAVTAVTDTANTDGRGASTNIVPVTFRITNLDSGGLVYSSGDDTTSNPGSIGSSAIVDSPVAFSLSDTRDRSRKIEVFYNPAKILMLGLTNKNINTWTNVSLPALKNLELDQNDLYVIPSFRGVDVPQGLNVATKPLIKGNKYVIVDPGNTSDTIWGNAGAEAYVAGTEFTYTGAATSGTGTVKKSKMAPDGLAPVMEVLKIGGNNLSRARTLDNEDITGTHQLNSLPLTIKELNFIGCFADDDIIDLIDYTDLEKLDFDSYYGSGQYRVMVGGNTNNVTPNIYVPDVAGTGLGIKSYRVWRHNVYKKLAEGAYTSERLENLDLYQSSSSEGLTGAENIRLEGFKFTGTSGTCTFTAISNCLGIDDEVQIVGALPSNTNDITSPDHTSGTYYKISAITVSVEGEITGATLQTQAGDELTTVASTTAIAATVFIRAYSDFIPIPRINLASRSTLKTIRLNRQRFNVLDVRDCTALTSYEQAYSDYIDIGKYTAAQRSVEGKFSGCNSLKTINFLESGSISGSITTAFANLAKLITLRLNKTSVTGQITDATFNGTTELNNLYLDGSTLGGVENFFSTNCFQNTNLIRLDVRNSANVTGSLPSLTTQTNLQYLYLLNNGLSGGIPDFAENTVLRDIFITGRVGGNSSDSLPSVVVKSGNTDGTFTTDNLFQVASGDLITVSGEISGSATITGYTNPTIYKVSNVSGNDFTLTTTGDVAIVTSFGDVEDIGSLGLSFNTTPSTGLTGGIPGTGFTVRGTSRTVDLSNNSLSGTIPNFSGAAYRTIRLNSNNLSGAFPNLSSASYLEYFEAKDNKISGYTAGSLTSNTRLKSLLLSNNKLTAADGTVIIQDLTDNWTLSPRRGVTIQLTNQNGLTENSIATDGSSGDESTYNKLLTLRSRGWVINLDS
jgi:hypothetical protein